jgi:hypothetical protein
MDRWIEKFNKKHNTKCKGWDEAQSFIMKELKMVQKHIDKLKAERAARKLAMSVMKKAKG